MSKKSSAGLPTDPSGSGKGSGESEAGAAAVAQQRTDVVDVAHDAPFVLFDGVLAWNLHDGTFRLTLAAVRGLPTGQGKAKFDYVPTCYLRGGLGAIIELHNTLGQIINAVTPTQGKTQ